MIAENASMKSTTDVADELVGEGYQVTPSMIHAYLRDRYLPPPDLRFGGRFVWSGADVDRLRGVLRRRGRGPVEPVLEVPCVC